MNYLPGDTIAPKVDYYNRKPNPLEMPPQVSIILPAYNAHNTIKRTIASICMQENVDEIEIINKCVERFNQTFSGALSPDIVRSTIMVHE